MALTLSTTARKRIAAGLPITSDRTAPAREVASTRTAPAPAPAPAAWECERRPIVASIAEHYVTPDPDRSRIVRKLYAPAVLSTAPARKLSNDAPATGPYNTLAFPIAPALLSDTAGESAEDMRTRWATARVVAGIARNAERRSYAPAADAHLMRKRIAQRDAVRASYVPARERAPIARGRSLMDAGALPTLALADQTLSRWEMVARIPGRWVDAFAHTHHYVIGTSGAMHHEVATAPAMPAVAFGNGAERSVSWAPTGGRNARTGSDSHVRTLSTAEHGPWTLTLMPHEHDAAQWRNLSGALVSDDAAQPHRTRVARTVLTPEQWRTFPTLASAAAAARAAVARKRNSASADRVRAMRERKRIARAAARMLPIAEVAPAPAPDAAAVAAARDAVRVK